MSLWYREACMAFLLSTWFGSLYHRAKQHNAHWGRPEENVLADLEVWEVVKRGVAVL